MSAIGTFVEAIAAVLILIGAAFALIGSIGLARLPDFFTRLHGPTKATTLGVGAIVIASLVYFSDQGDILSIKELALSLFLFITAPVSAHMLGKAARKSAGGDASSKPMSGAGNTGSGPGFQS